MPVALPALEVAPVVHAVGLRQVQAIHGKGVEVQARGSRRCDQRIRQRDGLQSFEQVSAIADDRTLGQRCRLQPVETIWRGRTQLPAGSDERVWYGFNAAAKAVLQIQDR